MNNELVVLNTEDVPVTTSLKVAERFGKRHGHVVDSIRLIIHTLKKNKIDPPNFRSVNYTDLKGESRPMFEMDRNAFSQLVGGFTGEKATLFRKDYADAFDAMEAELMKPAVALPNFTNPAEAARAWADQFEKSKQLELKVTEDAPKVYIPDNNTVAPGQRRCNVWNYRNMVSFLYSVITPGF